MKIRIEFEYETDRFKMSDGGILLKSSSGYFDMSRIAKDNNINIKIDRLYIYIIKNKKRKNNF